MAFFGLSGEMTFQSISYSTADLSSMAFLEVNSMDRNGHISNGRQEFSVGWVVCVCVVMWLDLGDIFFYTTIHRG